MAQGASGSEASSQIRLELPLTALGFITLVALGGAGFRELQDPEFAYLRHLSIVVAYFTLLAFLAVFHSLVTLSLRRSAYGFYALYLFCHGFTTAYREGLFVDLPEPWNAVFRLSIPASMLALLAFSRSFLRIQPSDPLAHRAILVAMAVWLASFIQVFFLTNPSVLPLFNTLQSILAPATGGLLVTLGIRAWAQGKNEARYFTLALWIHLIALLIYLLNPHLPLLPAPLAYYQLLFGSSVEITILTIALIELLRRSLEERNRAQAESIQHLQQLRQSEANQTAHLEHQIAQRTEALAAANAHREELFAILAHDLRAPLSGIIALTEDCIEQEQEGQDPQAMETLTLVHQSAKDLFALLENLLCWAQWNQNQLELVPETIDLKALMDEATALFQTHASQRQLTIKAELPPYLPKIKTDPRVLKIILRNLLSNAVRYSPPSGTITLNTQTSQGILTTSVIDQGPGMDPAKLEQLLHSGVAPNRSVASSSPGLGLGLILCRNLSLALGGSLSAETRPGSGCRFTLHLPLNL